jgi:transposase
LQRRLVREAERWQFVHRQVRALTVERRRRLLCDETPHVDQVRRLLGLAGIGVNGAWLLVYEFFGWRKLHNRKQAGALVGLTGTPYHSGGSEREQGISKAGSRRMRKMLVELAWCWLRWQPDSALSQWYARRFGSGKGPARKIGVVAVARKLLIALWRYLERDEVPAGAKLVDWQSKLTSSKARKPAA